MTWLCHFWSGTNVAPVYSLGEAGSPHLLSFFLALQRRVWEINLRIKQNKKIQGGKIKPHKGREVIFHFDNSVWLTSNCGREKGSVGLFESLRRKQTLWDQEGGGTRGCSQETKDRKQDFFYSYAQNKADVKFGRKRDHHFILLVEKVLSAQHWRYLGRHESWRSDDT